MPKFTEHSWKYRQDAQKKAAAAIESHNMLEPILQVLDDRPVIKGETGTSYFEWSLGKCICRIYYELGTIADILPMLEWAERCFGGEWKSTDSQAGVREFGLVRDDELGLDLLLSVSPDEELPDATCRRVLVGEDVRTEVVRTPKYKLVCGGGDASTS